MIEERIRAYNIIGHQFLTLIRMEFYQGYYSPLGRTLEIFQQKKLPIRFFSSDVSSKGDLILILGVDLLSEEMIDELIGELGDTENRHDLSLVSQVSMAMIYGPHFGEIPGIAGLTFSTLTNFGITPLSISASSSSLTCLFPSGQFKTALEILHAVFEPPQ